jgi:hypothetical protein
MREQNEEGDDSRREERGLYTPWKRRAGGCARAFLDQAGAKPRRVNTATKITIYKDIF